MKNKNNLNLTLWTASNKSFPTSNLSKTQLSLKASILLNPTYHRKFLKKLKKNQKKNLIINSQKNGKKKSTLFLNKRIFINSQPNTTETWPNFLYVFSRNTSSLTQINKYSLLRLSRKLRKSWRKTVLAWRIYNVYSEENVLELADNFWQEFSEPA